MTGTTLQTTWPSFKQMAGEFFRALPDADAESADAGFKCLTLGYVGLDATELEHHQASLVVKLAAKKMLERGLLQEHRL